MVYSRTVNVLVNKPPFGLNCGYFMCVSISVPVHSTKRQAGWVQQKWDNAASSSSFSLSRIY